MYIACLDLESVLIPELWVAVADAFGLDELRLTTRQVADKRALNAVRLKALKKSGITVAQIERVIKKVEPLPGAVGFLEWLKARMPFVIVTDCYLQLAAPVLKKIGVHAAIGHSWKTKDGKITSLPLRIAGDTKAPVVESYQKLGFKVLAVGDSLNDVGMLKAAQVGFFYKASPRAQEQAPKIKVAKSYSDLKKLIDAKVK